MSTSTKSERKGIVVLMGTTTALIIALLTFFVIFSDTVAVEQAAVLPASPLAIYPIDAVSPLSQFVGPALFDVTSDGESSRVDTTHGGSATRVAPGELLPVSVKLSNFGGGSRVDVRITYSIFGSAGNVVYTTNETVAVETTASFVKTIQIPFGTLPGIYTAKTSINYGGQLVPATTEFPFTVERKILGLFQSDFLLYGGSALFLSILLVLLSHFLIKRGAGGKLRPQDYSNIPRDKRTFYEILSDTILEMRRRIGDDALLIAVNIPGLKIDADTGRVLELTERPSKIIATLVAEYETRLGQKVSFSFRRT